jgi:hypothetical protein
LSQRSIFHIQKIFKANKINKESKKFTTQTKEPLQKKPPLIILKLWKNMKIALDSIVGKKQSDCKQHAK